MGKYKGPSCPSAKKGNPPQIPGHHKGKFPVKIFLKKKCLAGKFKRIRSSEKRAPEKVIAFWKKNIVARINEARARP